MKLISVKRIATLVGLVIFYGSIYAQTDTLGEKHTCDGYMNSTYVFEGKLDSAKYFTVQTGPYTYANYMAYLVEVDKVIKGNLQKGTIELVYYADGITYKGSDHVSSMKSSEPEDKAPGMGIYLGFDSARRGIASYYKNTNHKTLFFHGGIPIYKDGRIVKDPRGGISYYFSTLDDFYAYIKANYGIDVSGK